MAISKIKGGAINDDAISTDKIVDDAVTSDKIVDSYTTSLQTNPEFSGTEAARMPVGTTAERANAQSGDIRFNSTISLMEYYDGTQWKAIDSPPTISDISPSTFDASGDTITVTGSNFQTGVNVTVTGSDGTTYTPDSVTRNSSSELTFDITDAIFNGGLDAFDVTVANTSGLSVTSADALTIPNPTAAFNETATQTIYDVERSSGFDAGVTLTGDVSESDVTLSYALTTGSLPSGASLNTSTGAITGISAVGSDTTSNFTITATVADASQGTSVDVSRAFALTVAAPVITSYTSTGSGSFSVPTGVTVVDVLVVAGGGGGGRAGGGGAGGLIYRPAFPVTPQGSVSYSVGSGGQGQFGDSGPEPSGQNSTFGSLTALGGGYGSYSQSKGVDGGSGGGAGFNISAPQAPAKIGIGQQPSQPGDSGTYGFGNPGGEGGPSPEYGSNSGGGGGGAGAKGSYSGQTPVNPSGVWAQGGIGKQYDISGSQVYYAGGGSGAGHTAGDEPQSAAQGGGGRATRDNYPITIATANRGGGGGAAHNSPNQTGPYPNGGTGGSGIVIVKY
jgi:hypothetical protein